MQILTIKLRVRDKHAVELCRQSRTVNFVWNYCNEIQMKAVQSGRLWLNYYDLAKLTSGSSKELDLHSDTIQRICKIYDRSRTQRSKPFLKWRSKKSLGWVPFNTERVVFDGKFFIFRKVKYQTFNLNSKLKVGMKIKAGSFNCDSKGRWYINVPIELACLDVATKQNVGIDLGLKHLAVLSNGQKIEAPQFYRKSESKLAIMQRVKKSKRVKSINAKITNRRKDFLHKQSKKIAKEFGLIVIGDINSSNLIQTRMAKSVFDASWSSFKNMLSYKAIMHGGKMVETSEYMTSQTCSYCGSKDSNGRPKGTAGLGIREWTCSDCGTVHDRDVNAAKNILRSRLATLVEGTQIGRAHV